MEPTAADLEVTDQLHTGGTILGIELLDHLIIICDTYVSLTEKSDERGSL